MIKEGQVYQLWENRNNRLAVKCEKPKGFFETKTSGGGSYNMSGYAFKNYCLIAEYDTFEEAIASPEFKVGK